MSTEDHPDWWRPVGGQNSQDSTLERRSLIFNDDGDVDRADYPILGTDAVYKGKFFTRGCRGMIEEIQIWRTATAGGTITLRLSPHPCIGPFYEIIIPIGPADAWTGVAFEQMWNYDSLFIWVISLEAGEEWGYDAAQPYDGHESGDAGATWEDMAIRPFIRAVYTGETPGDVPVSGIINNIKIPNVSSIYQDVRNTVVPLGILTDLIVPVEGAGHIDLIIVDVHPAANSEQTWVAVECDGVIAFYMSYIRMNFLGLAPTTPGVTLTQYAAAGTCAVALTKLFEFRRELRVIAINALGAQTMDAYVCPTLLS